MMEGKSGHASVSIGSKMYVISESCEVFDLFSGKFALLQAPPLKGKVSSGHYVVIGSKIIVFAGSYEYECVVFDPEKSEWEKKVSFRQLGLYGSYHFVKYPKYICRSHFHQVP